MARTEPDEVLEGRTDIEVVRSEEELRVETLATEAGSIRVRKDIEETVDRRIVPRGIEHADIERIVVDGDDSGEIETLADGCVSIPVFEEEIVVTKRLVVRERILIRKRTVTEDHEIEATLRREHVEVDVDGDVTGRVHLDDDGVPGA